MIEKYRVHEVAKDLGVASKEVVDLLAANFQGERKSMTALNEQELSVIFNHYTNQNQVESFDEYFAAGRARKEAAQEARPGRPPSRRARPRRPPVRRRRARPRPSARRSSRRPPPRRRRPPRVRSSRAASRTARSRTGVRSRAARPEPAAAERQAPAGRL